MYLWFMFSPIYIYICKSMVSVIVSDKTLLHFYRESPSENAIFLKKRSFERPKKELWGGRGEPRIRFLVCILSQNKNWKKDRFCSKRVPQKEPHARDTLRARRPQRGQRAGQSAGQAARGARGPRAAGSRASQAAAAAPPIRGGQPRPRPSGNPGSTT